VGRILIVDDSVLMRRHLRTLVETCTSHEVVGEATNGTEALIQYRRLLPDLVTMDINMPAVDGLQAIRSIRAQFPAALIVAVSSIGEREKILEAVDAGAANFILKPVNQTRFVEVISAALH
jgi:two-component system chemotaxis response regulator CheY